MDVSSLGAATTRGLPGFGPPTGRAAVRMRGSVPIVHGPFYEVTRVSELAFYGGYVDVRAPGHEFVWAEPAPAVPFGSDPSDACAEAMSIYERPLK